MLAMKGALIWRTLNSNFAQMVNCNCTQGRGSIHFSEETGDKWQAPIGREIGDKERSSLKLF